MSAKFPRGGGAGPFLARSLLVSLLDLQSSFVKERASRFIVIFLLMDCDCKCSVAYPRDAVGWSAVCDCGIS